MTEPDDLPSRAEQRRRTEARILAAASGLFVEAGYERTTIRGIARAAGVDAGLVMHYFGSKQQLFQRVTHGSPPQELAGTPEEPVHSLAMLRSMLTHPEAAEAVRAGAAQYRAQISRSIPASDAGLRAELVSAVILGVVVSRHLLKSGGLTGVDPDHIIDLLRPCLCSLTRAGQDRR